jgi:dipeptidyl aminopeptidase/acylaminoacyl peptidase
MRDQRRKEVLMNPTRRSLLCAMVAAGVVSSVPRSIAAEPDRFGLFTSRIDGQDVQRILSDPKREMNHARVSPDKQWITFTRYNHYGPQGLAREDPEGYEESEIMLVRLDGSGLASLVPPKKGIVAANGQWTEDGKAILFVSNDNTGRRPQISRIDVATRRITRVALSDDLAAADPHIVDGVLAVSARDPRQKRMAIFLHDVKSGVTRQLTYPVKAKGEREGPLLIGDYDPKISPDGRKVATFRNVGKDNWHIVVVDVASGESHDISQARAVDAVPDWSSDGKLLVFWHVDPERLKLSGLYTVKPDGTARRRFPLPGCYLYTMPAFFPGEGSGPSARIVFSGQRNPAL